MAPLRLLVLAPIALAGCSTTGSDGDQMERDAAERAVTQWSQLNRALERVEEQVARQPLPRLRERPGS